MNIKRLIILAQPIVAAMLFSSAALAHEHHGHHHRHDRQHPHGHYYPMYRAPVVRHYYQAQPQYYPQPVYPAYYGGGYTTPNYAPVYDRRNPQGLLGGVIGSAMGYEIGRGDPLAAGIGAAAGSLLGNRMGGW